MTSLSPHQYARMFTSTSLALFFLVTALGTSLPVYAAENASYCPKASTEGYSVTTNQSVYQEGDAVDFCLSDNTRTPLFLAGLHPWQIENAANEIVFTPDPGTLNTSLQGSNHFSDQWNQMLADGTQASPGTYRVVFPGFPEKPSATFVILENTDATGSSTVSSTSTTGALDALWGQVHDLAAQIAAFERRLNAFVGSSTVL